jgi:hypothetical protein
VRGVGGREAGDKVTACCCSAPSYNALRPSLATADGPFWGGNPIWGALGATVLSLIIGSVLSYILVNVRSWFGTFVTANCGWQRRFLLASGLSRPAALSSD